MFLFSFKFAIVYSSNWTFFLSYKFFWMRATLHTETIRDWFSSLHFHSHSLFIHWLHVLKVCYTTHSEKLFTWRLIYFSNSAHAFCYRGPSFQMYFRIFEITFASSSASMQTLFYVLADGWTTPRQCLLGLASYCSVQWALAGFACILLARCQIEMFLFLFFFFHLVRLFTRFVIYPICGAKQKKIVLLGALHHQRGGIDLRYFIAFEIEAVCNYDLSSHNWKKNLFSQPPTIAQWTSCLSSMTAVAFFLTADIFTPPVSITRCDET